MARSFSAYQDEPAAELSCSYRNVDDDFFCQRYGVWYPSIDCAVRTRFKTAGGCLKCDQGRFNLKRHAAAVSTLRFRIASGD